MLISIVKSGLKVQVEGREISYSDNFFNEIDIDSIIKEVCKRYNKEPEELYASKKKPVLAKKFIIYLAKKFTQLTNVEIGDRFGITYSAVSKAAGSIERAMGLDKDMSREVNEIISHFKG